MGNPEVPSRVPRPGCHFVAVLCNIPEWKMAIKIDPQYNMHYMYVGVELGGGRWVVPLAELLRGGSL